MQLEIASVRELVAEIARRLDDEVQKDQQERELLIPLSVALSEMHNAAHGPNCVARTTAGACDCFKADVLQAVLTVENYSTYRNDNSGELSSREQLRYLAKPECFYCRSGEAQLFRGEISRHACDLVSTVLCASCGYRWVERYTCVEVKALGRSAL